jgi:hypothetical protein
MSEADRQTGHHPGTRTRSPTRTSTRAHPTREVQRAAGQADITEFNGAIYCKDCEIWLNGDAQWQDHRTGGKHRKAVQKTRQDLETNALNRRAEDGNEDQPMQGMPAAHEKDHIHEPTREMD